MSEQSSLADALRISFRDPGLLMQALVHRSYLHEHPESVLPSNERLEFLGDAVLGLVIASHLYHRYPEMDEGELTALRAAVVKAATLARVASQLGLGQHILMGKGEESSGGRSRAALLAGAFEALVGAIMIDQGLDAAQDFAIRHLAPILDEIVRAELHRDDKSRLQELTQGLLGLTPTYRVVEVSGPDHDRLFTVEVWSGQQALGRGRGRSKREAEQAAARDALARLETAAPDGDS